MSDTQGRIGLIAETLLTASSARERSLQGIDTDGLIEGTVCHVAEDGSNYVLKPDDTNTPNNTTIVAAAGAAGGNWVLASGRNPVEVRSLADLPAAVGGAITLVGNTDYFFVGTIDLGTDYLIIPAAGGISLAGIPGNSVITSSNVTQSTLYGTNLGTDLTISGLEIINTAGLAAAFLDFVAGSSVLRIIECKFTGGSNGLTVQDAYELFCCGTSFEVLTAGDCLDVPGATTQRVRALDCRFVNADGNGLRLSGGAGSLDFAQVVGCAFDCDGAGDDAIDMVNAGALVTGATLTGCTFEGTATIPGANITNPNGWVARGNVSFADF